MEQFKSCLNCAYHTLNPQKCPLIGYAYSGNGNQVCPYWAHELPKCDYCGRIEQDCSILEATDGNWKRLCHDCRSKLGTCAMCKKSITCDFETNPSPIPKAVEKRFQQGNQIMVTTVKNEERIRETCRKNCKCFSEEFGCLRENGTCGKYEGVF